MTPHYRPRTIKWSATTSPSITVSLGQLRERLGDLRIAQAEVLVIARTEVNRSLALERDGAVAVKFMPVFPALSPSGNASIRSSSGPTNVAVAILRGYRLLII